MEKLCPYCGQEMDLGYIQSRDDLVWTREKKKLAAFAGWGTGIELGDCNLLGNATVEVWNCFRCKKLVIEYD